MISSRKMSKHAFNQAAYNDCDSKAKEVAIKYLSSIGIQARENDNEYGIDLLAVIGNREIGIEVEVKVAWELLFPWSTITIPYRKRRFMIAGDILFLFNHDFTQMAIVPEHTLKRLIRKNTKSTENELFFDIPTEEATFICLVP